MEPFNFSFFSVTGWNIDLDYHDIEWLASETNRDHSVVFEIAPKYCILDSFVDHDGYSISSKGLLLGTSFSVLSFCLFILFMGFSRQEY